ncbi:MAG: VPDSG-CTERM sorting domain-containing protein [Opitutaceae bacterium]|nr:VPDSG-CTERM sorting domain-containing protein [Opitutaceae bacterium]
MKLRLVTLTSGLFLGLSSLTSAFAGQDNGGWNCAPAVVPDSGSTMLLLGAGLVGMVLMLRRKLNK